MTGKKPQTTPCFLTFKYYKFPKIRDFKDLEEFQLPTPEFLHLVLLVAPLLGHKTGTCTVFPEDNFDVIKEDLISATSSLQRPVSQNLAELQCCKN